MPKITPKKTQSKTVEQPAKQKRVKPTKVTVAVIKPQIPEVIPYIEPRPVDIALELAARRNIDVDGQTESDQFKERRAQEDFLEQRHSEEIARARS